MKYLPLDDQFKYGISCKLNWSHYMSYVVERLPVILTELLNRSDEEKRLNPYKDGYYAFKRYNEDETKIIIY